MPWPRSKFELASLPRQADFLIPFLDCWDQSTILCLSSLSRLIFSPTKVNASNYILFVLHSNVTGTIDGRHRFVAVVRLASLLLSTFIIFRYFCRPGRCRTSLRCITLAWTHHSRGFLIRVLPFRSPSSLMARGLNPRGYCRQVRAKYGQEGLPPETSPLGFRWCLSPICTRSAGVMKPQGFCRKSVPIWPGIDPWDYHYGFVVV